MDLEIIFSIVNTVALLSWVLLIVLPKKQRGYLYTVCKFVTFPLLALLYAGLMFSYFTSSGGGFDTFENVRKLLSNDWVLLAGWIHYLVFDLFVGIYIAKKLDDRNIGRIFQSFFLLLTFMFGPAGFLTFITFIFLVTYINKYIYFLYPKDLRLGLDNKIYSYTLYSLAFSLALFPMILLAYYIDTRTISDVNVWTKPLKFISSFAIHLTTIILVAPLINKKYFESKFLVWTTIVASYSLVLEIVYIAIQALRGRASHYNDLTQFESFMYGLMGLGAVLGVIGSFVLGYYIYKHARENTTFGIRFGAGGGLMISSVLIFFVAGYLGGNGSHFIDKGFQNINLLPIVGWSTIYGDLRVSHFFANHTMQFLPIVGLVSLYIRKKYQKPFVILAAIFCVFVVCFTFWQALQNIPFISY